MQGIFIFLSLDTLDVIVGSYLVTFECLILGLT